MAKTKFNLVSFLIRVVIAMAVVFLTYNPFGWSFYDWALTPPLEFSPLKALAGVALVISWAVLLRATGRSLGPFGFILAAAFFGVLIWLVIDWFNLQADNLKTIITLIEAALGMVLGAGLSWSHVRRRITGQLDVDETDS